MVGIERDSIVDSSSAVIRNDNTRIDALHDLIASLSSGSDKSSSSSNNTSSAWQVLTNTLSFVAHHFCCFFISYLYIVESLFASSCWFKCYLKILNFYVFVISIERNQYSRGDRSLSTKWKQVHRIIRRPGHKHPLFQYMHALHIPMHRRQQFNSIYLPNDYHPKVLQPNGRFCLMF